MSAGSSVLLLSLGQSSLCYDKFILPRISQDPKHLSTSLLKQAGQKEPGALPDGSVKPNHQRAGPVIAIVRAKSPTKVMHEASVSEVAQAILDYLRHNPEAQDTLAGIDQWWLPEQENKARTATIKEALDELVAAGLITQHRGKDEQISYRLTSQGLRNLQVRLKEEG